MNFAASSAAAFPPPQRSLQRRLKSIIDRAASLTYAIFWLPAHSSGHPSSDAAAVLRWADGYLAEDQPTPPASHLPAAEQELRRRFVRELYSRLFGGGSGESAVAADVAISDTDWFFFLSMTKSFTAGEGFLGQAFLGGRTIWIAGADALAASSCGRARQGRSLGLQTMAWIPTEDGVVELGSDVVVLQCPDLVNEFRVSINLTNLSL